MDVLPRNNPTELTPLRFKQYTPRYSKIEVHKDVDMLSSSTHDQSIKNRWKSCGIVGIAICALLFLSPSLPTLTSDGTTNSTHIQTKKMSSFSTSSPMKTGMKSVLRPPNTRPLDVWSTPSKTYPTNEWWENLAMGGNGDVELGPENFANALTYHVDVSDPDHRGLRVAVPSLDVESVPNRYCQVIDCSTVDNESPMLPGDDAVVSTADPHFAVTLSDHSTVATRKHRIPAYGKLGVGLTWSSTSAAGQGTSSDQEEGPVAMRSPVVYGMSMATMEYYGQTLPLVKAPQRLSYPLMVDGLKSKSIEQLCFDEYGEKEMSLNDDVDRNKYLGRKTFRVKQSVEFELMPSDHRWLLLVSEPLSFACVATNTSFSLSVLPPISPPPSVPKHDLKEAPTISPLSQPTIANDTDIPSHIPSTSPSLAQETIDVIDDEPSSSDEAVEGSWWSWMFAPSASPTASPTTTPQPSRLPTSTPTFIPTSHPTPRPTTKAPVIAPTAHPTLSPSRAPTSHPSSKPSVMPTTLPPTLSPTSSPTTTPIFPIPTKILRLGLLTKCSTGRGSECETPYNDLISVNDFNEDIMRRANDPKLRARRDLLIKYSKVYPTEESTVSYKVSDELNVADLSFSWKHKHFKTANTLSPPPSTKSSRSSTSTSDVSDTMLVFGLHHHLKGLAKMSTSRMNPSGHIPTNSDGTAYEIYGDDTSSSSSSMHVDALCLSTVRGNACPIVGSVWKMRIELPPNRFSMKQTPASYRLDALNEALAQDLKYEPPMEFKLAAGSTYVGGKMLAKMARIALIAHDMGRRQEGITMANKLATYLDTWLSSDDALSPFLYDEAWGGVLSCGCYFDPHGKKCFNQV